MTADCVWCNRLNVDSRPVDSRITRHPLRRVYRWEIGTWSENRFERVTQVHQSQSYYSACWHDFSLFILEKRIKFFKKYSIQKYNNCLERLWLEFKEILNLNIKCVADDPVKYRHCVSQASTIWNLVPTYPRKYVECWYLKLFYAFPCCYSYIRYFWRMNLMSQNTSTFCWDALCVKNTGCQSLLMSLNPS